MIINDVEDKLNLIKLIIVNNKKMKDLVNNFNLQLGGLRVIFIVNIVLTLYNLLINFTFISINIVLFPVINFYIFGYIIMYIRDYPEVLDLIPISTYNLLWR